MTDITTQWTAISVIIRLISDTPKPLTELCRSVVRGCIDEYDLIPEYDRIDELGIPKELCDYIRHEDIEDKMRRSSSSTLMNSYNQWKAEN